MGLGRGDLLECARVVAGMIGEEDVDAVFLRLTRRLAKAGCSLADLEEIESEAFEIFLRHNGERLRFLQQIAMLDDELPVRIYEGPPESPTTVAAAPPSHALPS